MIHRAALSQINPRQASLIPPRFFLDFFELNYPSLSPFFPKYHVRKEKKNPRFNSSNLAHYPSVHYSSSMATTSMTVDGGPSDLLAPGFRFHPTDEELVSYYLKRKISGRRLRVDAIAEVDIYRVEPWDLPAMSKLRSRDMEWYFFSTLDRKYSNRTRTNRATSEGYWKTTGKDRPVHDRHRSVLVGMKKTLVFHVGRAPKGERTNWVMHEYRLHTDEADNAQEGYVVCRIFQKTAPGPQNGAQYGAPFVEEEWVEEDDEEMVVPPPKGEEEEGTIGLTDNQYVQLDDFNCDQKEELANQNEINTLFAMDANEQNGGTNSENPADLFEDIFNVDNYINVPELHDDANLMYNLEENSGLCAEYQKSPDQNDGYLELKDIFDNENMGYPPNESSFGCLEGIFNDQTLANGVNEIPTFQEVDTDFFIGNGTETAEPQQLDQMCLPVKGELDLELDGSQNPVAGDYHSGQGSEDNVVFYDAPNEDIPYSEDNFVDTSEMHFLSVPDFDKVDDLIAYFDATETNFPYIQDPSESREFNSCVAQPNLALEVERNNSAACKEVGDASTSTGLPEAGKKFVNVEKDVNYVPDAERKGSWNKSLTNHVVNMLGSISAPPAMAEDPGKQKTIGLISASRASSSIRVSAGMIHVDGEEHWALQKNGDIGFLLSYGMSGSDFEMNTKVQCGSMSMVLSGGFYLFGISMLILAVSFKVGMCICNS